MTSAQPAATPTFQLFSIGFGGSGTPPLPMRDLLTDLPIGGLGVQGSPEWVLNHRSAPVAYSQGALATLQVVFQACNVDQFPSGEPYTIEATGDLLNVAPKSVAIALRPLDGFSDPLPFALSGPIPGGIGVRRLTLAWTATDAAGYRASIGTSVHTIYVTSTALDLGADLLPPIGPYQPLAQLATQWAAGQTTPEGICKALVTGMATLGIARSPTGSDARAALLLRRANSRGFTAVLSQLLQSQGIRAAPRALSVDWQSPPTDAVNWVPSTTPLPIAIDTGPETYLVCLIPSATGVLLCDGAVGLGPISLPFPLPPDRAWTLSGPAFDLMHREYLVPARQILAGMVVGMMPEGPVKVFSVHFAFAGGHALQLRDVVTDARIGGTPEWVLGIDQIPPVDGQAAPAALPAAFVRGTTVAMEVRFLRTWHVDPDATPLTLTIGATGTPAGVEDQTVTLIFGTDGVSQAVAFTLDRVIATDVGRTTLALEWHATTAPNPATPIGTTTHPLCFTWKPMIADAVEGLPDFAYSSVVEWTCEFAAGATSDKDVCDRVFANLEKTDLRYGVAGWTPRQILLGGGGMCGGWYQLFQWMLHCQGVFVEKRAFLVDWRQLAGTHDVQWNALVVSSGGINQPVPPVTPSVFHDLSVFPVPTTATPAVATAQRYRFWGLAGAFADGHCVNFLSANGELFLYDASFAIGPIPLTMPLPPKDGTVLAGTALGDFVEKYLRVAVSHMLGSFTVGGVEYCSVAPVGAAAGVNGVSVATSALPTSVGTVPTISFAWI